MLTFFRRIRRSLLKENRVSRYFLYALGEILLVVIGILIALQANNWNEYRKTLNAIEETKKALIEELDGNIQKSERTMTFGAELAIVLDALRNRNYNHEMDMEFGSFYGDFNLFDTFTFDLRRDNMDKWIGFEKDLPLEYKDHIWIAKQLKHLMDERKSWETIATGISTSRFKEFVDELPWFYDQDSLSIQKRKEYIKNDPFFRNKAIHYLDFQLNENVAYTTQVRSWTLILLWRLQEEANGNSADIMNKFMKGYSYRPFKAIACGGQPYISAEFIGYRQNHLIYNASNETKAYSLVNSLGEVKRAFNIKSKELLAVTIYPNEFIQVGTSCEAIYSPVKRGYLIID